MENPRYKKYYFTALAAVIAVCAYPIYMGVSVLIEMLRGGAVPLENYPKYIIPYTPIALSMITGVAIIPLMQKLSRKLDYLYGSLVSVGAFFLAERFMETNVLVQTQELIPLEGWQMALCYVPPEQYKTRTWEAVDVLLGGYSPTFKIHFYLISVVIILSLLNCFYGFAKMIRSGDSSRKKALTMQAATSLAFLAMCIWACFTAFYRGGELTVSPVSAVLMAVFFALLGVTMGVFVGSLTLNKRRALATLLPAATAALITVAMYVGEMFLLSGNLYRFGEGFFFDGIPGIVLAPVDVLVVIASGGVTYLLMRLITRGKAVTETADNRNALS